MNEQEVEAMLDGIFDDIKEILDKTILAEYDNYDAILDEIVQAM